MKCTAILALATGAYAVQDVTPPVISLTLNEQDLRAYSHHSGVDGLHADATAHVARTCAVALEDDAAAALACPDPVCSAHDHHDGSVICTDTVELINNDGITTGPTINSAYSTADRSLRSMWLYKYDAQDQSKNAAEQVTFELTIYDHEDPSLTINSVWGPAHVTGLYQNQACNMGNSDNTYGTNPCTWNVLLTDASAHDDYDKDITSLIVNSVTAPGSTANVQAHAAYIIDTQLLGDWKLHWGVCDRAGQYGKGGASNCVVKDTMVTIVDTWMPIITIKENTAVKNDYECGTDDKGSIPHAYAEHGAYCKDIRDSYIASSSSWEFDTIAPTIVSTVDTLTEGTYTVTYTCADEESQAADPKVRSVTVVDRTNPVIGFGANVDSTIENSAGAHNNGADRAGENADTGLFDATYLGGASAYTCTDTCYANPATTAKLHYGGDCSGSLVGNDGALTNFPEYTAGDYSIKYVCSDKPGGLSASICRKIQNVDHTRPVLQILGSDNMTLEATHEGNYIDDGATCSDQVDGVISQNVEVSGDVVNLSKVGSYTITYNCKDSAGNTAPTLSRSVHVKQTSCPTCVITDFVESLQHEASFPYTDAGAVCTDIIDGTVATIKIGTVNVQTTGPYVITYRAQNSVGLYNDGKDASGAVTTSSGCRGTAISYTRTVIVKDTLKPVIKLTYQSNKIAWGSAGNAKNDALFVDGVHVGNNYMAEEASTSSVNGWVLGAIASAVTGLALLGFSQRKTPVATSVPV